MATLPGVPAEFVSIRAQGHLPGRTAGIPLPRTAFGRRFFGIVSMVGESEADTHIDVVPSVGPGSTASILTGSLTEFQGNTGREWFDRIHVFPGGAVLNVTYDQNYRIEFGNIIADVDKFYEIYNAHRSDTQTLISIDLSQVNPGIETPGVSASDTIGPAVSLTDPTSTFNTDGVTGFGTLIFPIIRALIDGVPSFRGDAIFQFGIGAAELPLSGARIALNIAEYEAPVVEYMEFKTNILESSGGREQRISLRAQPREGMSVLYRLDLQARQRFQAVLMDWQENPFGVPLYHEQVPLTTDSGISSTQWSVSGADGADFRVGGLAILLTDIFNFEVSTILSVTNTLVTVSSANQKAHLAGAIVMPIRVARIIKFPSGGRFITSLEDFKVTYEWLNNVTGAPTGSSTAWNPNTYAGRILLDDCNVMKGSTLSETFERNIAVVDGNTGVVSQASGWDKNKHVWQKGFVAHNQTEVQDLKALLRYLRGRQKAFWLPTSIEDITATASVTASSQILDIVNIDYARYVRNRLPKSIIRLTFNDGATSEIHVIESSAAHPTDEEQERLTIASPGFTASHALSTFSRIEFLELVRMDADKFTLRFSRVAQATLTAPIRAVFDDD